MEENTVNNPKLADIQKLCSTARERVDLGELNYKTLVDFICNISVSEVANIRYHSECRKPIVNKTNLERLRKRCQSVSSVTTGRPSITDDNSRPKLFKTTRKDVVCVRVCVYVRVCVCVYVCLYIVYYVRRHPLTLHRVYTDGRCQSLLHVKDTTTNDTVRACVSDLEETGMQRLWKSTTI